jgi:hypothetical protein
MLEKLPSIVTITTFASLCLAISHEWAYYDVIGSEYQALYTTSDYITLLVWSTGAAFLVVMTLGLLQFVAFRSDNFTVPSFSMEKTLGGFMDRNEFLVALALCTLLDFLFSTSQVNVWAYGLFAYIVFRGLLYIFGHEKMRRYAQGWYALLVYGLPVGMIVSYGIGKASAYEDIGNKHPRYELRLKDQYVSRDVNVLRFPEKGVIVFDPIARKVEFVRQDMILGVITKAPELDSRSFACKHWEVMCAPPKPNDAHNS